MPALAESDYTAVSQIPEICASLRASFASGTTRPLDKRKEQLKRIHDLLAENEVELAAAAKADLNKAAIEFYANEIMLTSNECVEHIQALDEWAAPEFPSVSLIAKPDKCQIRKEPLGVVLIIGAFNYPLQLCLLPVVGAISAGNTVVLTPSEASGSCAKLFEQLLTKYMDPNVLRVVNGGREQKQSLLQEKFDHILYTGGGTVGKIIAGEASKSLTPVTLELGGKSPAIVDKNVDMRVVGQRIAWGKCLNAGQTCIAPDYVLCQEGLEAELVASIHQAITGFYGKDVASSPDFGRMVSPQQYNRVQALINANPSERIHVCSSGEASEASSNFLAPTLITGCNGSEAIMQEEIFGPALPIVTVKDIPAAIAFVNARDKPLALYVFSQDRDTVERVMNETSSGAALANDTMMHAAVPELPFGGVGGSGMGAYHGKLSFDLFSHRKAVMVKSLGLEKVNELVRYPPYWDGQKHILNMALQRRLGDMVPVAFKMIGGAVFVITVRSFGGWTHLAKALKAALLFGASKL